MYPVSIASTIFPVFFLALRWRTTFCSYPLLSSLFMTLLFHFPFILLSLLSVKRNIVLHSLLSMELTYLGLILVFNTTPRSTAVTALLPFFQPRSKSISFLAKKMKHMRDRSIDSDGGICFVMVFWWVWVWDEKGRELDALMDAPIVIYQNKPTNKAAIRKSENKAFYRHPCSSSFSFKLLIGGEIEFWTIPSSTLFFWMEHGTQEANVADKLLQDSNESIYCSAHKQVIK